MGVRGEGGVKDKRESGERKGRGIGCVEKERVTLV